VLKKHAYSFVFYSRVTATRLFFLLCPNEKAQNHTQEKLYPSFKSVSPKVRNKVCVFSFCCISPFTLWFSTLDLVFCSSALDFFYSETDYTVFYSVCKPRENTNKITVTTKVSRFLATKNKQKLVGPPASLWSSPCNKPRKRTNQQR